MLKLKKSILIGALALSLFASKNVVADIIDTSGTSNLAIEKTVQDASYRLKNLGSEDSVKAVLNVYLHKKGETITELDKNSINIIINTDINDVRVKVSDELTEIIPKEMIETINTSSGITEIELGSLESGLESLIRIILNEVSVTSLGTNEYVYNKEEKEAKEKEAVQEKKKSQEKTLIILVSSVVGATVVFSGIYFLSNKRGSSVNKLVYGRKEEEQRNKFMSELEIFLSDNEVLEQSGFNYMSRAYQNLGLEREYETIQKDTLDKCREHFGKYLVSANLDTLNASRLFDSYVEKFVPEYKKYVFNDLDKKVQTEYPDARKEVFQSHKYKELLNNYNLTPEMLTAFVENESLEYTNKINERKEALQKSLEEIIKSVQFVTDKEEIRKELFSYITEVEQNYSDEAYFTTKQVVDKYTSKAYKVLANLRLDKLSSVDSVVREYIFENMSDVNIVKASNKVLKRTINKAKILNK